MSAFQTHIVERFIQLYGPPQTSNVPGFLADYERELAGIDQGILREASDILVRKHLYRNWPTIGECLAAVRDATYWREQAAKVRAAVKPEPARVVPPKPSIARVDAMIAKFKAHVAAEEAQASLKAAPFVAPNAEQWSARQSSLRKAGKWASSIMGRAA